MFDLCKELLNEEEIRTVDVIGKIHKRIADGEARLGALKEHASPRQVVTAVNIAEEEFLSDEKQEELNKLFDHLNVEITNQVFDTTKKFLESDSNALESKNYTYYIPERKNEVQ